MRTLTTRRTMALALVAGLTLALTPGARGGAQQAEAPADTAAARPVAPGDTVRAWDRDRMLRGEERRLLAATPDSLSLGPGRRDFQPAVVVSWASLTRLEVRRGSRRSVAGAVIGGTLGFLIGALVGGVIDVARCPCSRGDVGQVFPAATLLGAAAGAWGGVSLGRRLRAPAWAPVPLPAAVPPGAQR